MAENFFECQKCKQLGRRKSGHKTTACPFEHRPKSLPSLSEERKFSEGVNPHKQHETFPKKNETKGKVSLNANIKLLPPRNGFTSQPPPLPGEGKLVLVGTVGSTAYGLSHAGSDIDTLGIYVAPLHKILSLQGTEELSKTYSKTSETQDFTYHEIGKYLKLAIKCNPTILELLYLPGEMTQLLSAEGQTLVKNRNEYLSKHQVLSSYSGYSYSEMLQIMKRFEQVPTRDSVRAHEIFKKDKRIVFTPQQKRLRKSAVHCLRLIHQGGELLKTGEMTVNISSVKDELIEQGNLAVLKPEKFKSLVTQKMGTLKSFTAESPLAEKPNISLVNDMLYRIRLRS